MGIGVESFTNEDGLSPTSIALREQRYGRGRGRILKGDGKIPVHIVHQLVQLPSATGDEDIVEVSTGGVVVRLRSGIDPAYVAELVARLCDRC